MRKQNWANRRTLPIRGDVNALRFESLSVNWRSVTPDGENAVANSFWLQSQPRTSTSTDLRREKRQKADPVRGRYAKRNRTMKEAAGSGDAHTAPRQGGHFA